MTTLRLTWVPAAILALGCVANRFISAQRTMPLATPLERLSTDVEGHLGENTPISPDEARVAGASSSLLRLYSRDSSSFSVYVGYYESQRQGKTIHSPKNCLPGAGWEPLESRLELVPGLAGQSIKVNRFLIANRNQQALVYYWYQGRGRTEANEYKVKLDLIRDSAIRRRSDEALVRIVVPLTGSDEGADQLARRVVARLHAELESILPS